MKKEENVLSKILRIVPEAKHGLTVSLGIGLVYEIVKFVPVILIKIIVDSLIEGSTIKALSYLVGGIFLSYIVLTIIDFVAKRLQFTWTHEYDAAILRKAKKKLLEMHLSFHESYNTGEQVAKITKGAHKLSELIWFAFNEFIPTSIQLILTVILLIYEQWILAFIFGIFLPIVTWLSIYASKKVQPYRERHHKNYDQAIGELGESLFNIATIKDYVQEKKQLTLFNALLAKYLVNAKLRNYYAQTILFWRDMLISIGRILTLGVAVYMVLKGIISPGSLVLVYSLTERAFLSTYRIGRLYYYLEDALESINRLAKLFEEQPLIVDAPGAEKTKTLQGKIEFKDATFAYRNEKPILHNINLIIAPRQVAALVGRSGEGNILIDGRDIRSYKLEDYKRRIAVVSQNVEIFNRSALENIIIAKPKASRSEIIAAAKKANAHDFIMQLPQGYDTIVGEKGVRLSGGQKQRLSIARALLADPDIYIFDEATSSLDSESEQLIQQSIFNIAGKKTTIIIAHRLSTIRHADVIVVMDDGKIIEKGTYLALIKKQGAFAKMIQLQEISGIRK